ncbi:MAG TPA: DNA repair protein RadA [Chloroflexota bacterium]|nr:DNA repair protein RadA [Chloroflexota bacterium]
MAKRRTSFVCQQCASQYPTQYGRCPGCGAWNSLVETIQEAGPPSSPTQMARSIGAARPTRLREVSSDNWARRRIPIVELDRVLGGGLVPGSLVLIGGDPGIGKSTLLLQLCLQLSQELTVLYVTGEESAEQVKLRADRLGSVPPELYLLAEVDIDTILSSMLDIRPALMVVDSIQTMQVTDIESAAGSVSQVRESTARLMHAAKTSHVPIVIVGHVTKEGAIAGPRVLEHIVDTVLYLEGDSFHAYRLLRSVKNRFGSTNEVGVFEMRDDGMVEVPNPSAAFLAERGTSHPGSAVAATLEGTRPLLAEIQALVSATTFSLPRRTCAGMDLNRLHLLLAILSKRAGLPLHTFDVYCNVVGGLRLGEPAADLPTALAIVSSLTDTVVPPDMLAFGELGLSGEVRAVSRAADRVSEAGKLGFTRVMLPATNARALRGKVPSGMQLDGVGTIQEAMRLVMPHGAPARGERSPGRAGRRQIDDEEE